MTTTQAVHNIMDERARLGPIEIPVNKPWLSNRCPVCGKAIHRQSKACKRHKTFHGKPFVGIARLNIRTNFKYRGGWLKTQARLFVSRMTRNGIIPPARKMKCTDCGKPAHSWDHYKGYRKKHWGDVQAVCQSCHLKRDYSRRSYPKLDAARRMNGMKQAKICKHGIIPRSHCVDCMREDNTNRWRRRKAPHLVGRPPLRRGPVPLVQGVLLPVTQEAR